MKRMLKVFGCTLCSLLLALGMAAPAFAAEGEVEDGSGDEEMVLRNVFLGCYYTGDNTKFDRTGESCAFDIMHGYDENGDLIYLMDYLSVAPQWNEDERQVVIDDADYDTFLSASKLKMYQGSDGCAEGDPIHGGHVQCYLYAARMMPASWEPGSGASTVVTLSTYTSHIHVTVPLSITMSFDRLGGQGYAPKNYTIRNRTSVPVCVSTAVAEPVSGGLFSIPKYGFGTTESTSKYGEAVSGARFGDIWASFTPKDETQSDKVMLLDADNAGQTQNVNWVIPAKPVTNDDAITFYVYDEQRYETDADSALACAEAIINNNKSLNDKKRARLRAAASAGWSELMRLSYEWYEDGDIDARVIDSNDANEYTSFGFDISANSSILSYPEQVSDRIAGIVFTVGVARNKA